MNVRIVRLTFDPVVFAGLSALLIAVASLATLPAAVSAARQDPLAMLRRQGSFAAQECLRYEQWQKPGEPGNRRQTGRTQMRQQGQVNPQAKGDKRERHHVATDHPRLVDLDPITLDGQKSHSDTEPPCRGLDEQRHAKVSRLSVERKEERMESSTAGWARHSSVVPLVPRRDAKLRTMSTSRRRMLLRRQRTVRRIQPKIGIETQGFTPRLRRLHGRADPFDPSIILVVRQHAELRGDVLVEPSVFE
jgi:hypothetical protein